MTTLDEIKQIGIKNRIWNIATFACTLILVYTIMRYSNPAPSSNDSKVNVLVRENRVINDQNKVLKSLVSAQQKMYVESAKSDSMIFRQIEKNGQNVSKNRLAVLTNRSIYLKNVKQDHEAINNINIHNSNQLSREVSDIERFYMSSK